MAVGGMPQAVEAYVEGKNFSEIDMVKRQIISLYEDDFKKMIAFDFDNPTIDEYYFSVLKGYDLFDMKDQKIKLGGQDE